MVNIENTKNDWFWYINENLEFCAFSIDIGISQNASSYTKSYKNDKMKKIILWKKF